MTKKTTLLFMLLIGLIVNSYSQYSLCADAVPVTLPYTHTDNTANYADTNYEGSPGATGCGTTSTYLNGNDVVYSFTAPSNNTMKLTMTTTGTWSGMFVYESCANIGVSCFAGGRNSGAGGVTLPAVAVTAGTTYYVVISTWPAPQTIPYTLSINENTCTNATATYAVVSDCAVAPQFYVDVNISDLGTATSLTVSDNQSSPTQNTSASGILTFGPYPNATPVIFTITNDQDANCVVVSPPKTQASCPPANDNIAAATELILDLGTACGANQLTLQSITSTTASLEVTPTCAFSNTGVSGDVWYKIVVPYPDFKLNVSNVTGTNFFTASGELYSGSPGSLTAVGGNCGNTWPKNYTGLTSGDTYYLRIWDYNNDGTGTFSVCGYYLDCVNATATYAIVSDCVNAPQFFVDVNVTSLGSATSLTVSDNQGSPTQVVSNTGLVNFGPYPNNTPVIVTLGNDQNAACTITSPAQNQLACPGVNDECANAIALTVNPNLSCAVVTGGTVLLATASSTDTTSCAGTEDDDVWFSFVATETNHKVNLLNVTGSTIDMYHSLWTGVDCDNLTLVPNSCSDNDSSNPTGLTVGQTYYLRVYTYTATPGQNSSFSVCIGTNPPPPANDTCDGALPITQGASFAQNAVVGSTGGATTTTTGLPVFTCVPTARANDVWYIVTPLSTTMTVETTSAAGSLLTDTVLGVFSGTCGALTAIGCDDDNGTDAFSKIDLTGLTIGDPIYIGVWRYNNGIIVDGDFQLSAYNTSLASATFESASFAAYPNPVTDILNLSYSKNIDKVLVMNLLGQEVQTKAINATNAKVDMSNLASGTYLVKITSDNQVKTLKVVKN